MKYRDRFLERLLVRYIRDLTGHGLSTTSGDKSTLLLEIKSDFSSRVPDLVDKITESCDPQCGAHKPLDLKLPPKEYVLI